MQEIIITTKNENLEVTSNTIQFEKNKIKYCLKFSPETKKDFMMNIILAELGIFNTISFFCYSERKGTLAAKLGNKINLFEKRRRIEIISKISEQSPKCVFNYPRNLKIDGV